MTLRRAPRAPGAPRRRHRAGAVLVALVAVMGAAACTVPSDDQARPIDPARLASSSTNKRNCTSPGVDAQTATVRVYLVSQQGDPPFVTAVDRIVTTAAAPTPFLALSALFDCLVTEEDRRAGRTTAIPEETQLLGFEPVSSQPGVFEVRLGPLRNLGGQTTDDLDKVAVAQIFFTATAADFGDTVRELKFTINGRAVAVNTDKRTVGQSDTVRRDDFLTSSPPTTTTPPPSGTVGPGSVSTTR